MQTTAKNLRISRNSDMYGACRSIVVYRDHVEIVRAAMFYRDGKLAWEIGPTGFPGADDFDLELRFEAASISREDMLDRVETALRLSISAAETTKEAA